MEIIRNRVISYSVEENKCNCFNQNYAAIGHSNVISTLNDMLKWNNNFVSGKVGGKAFLKLMSSKGYLNNNIQNIFG